MKKKKSNDELILTDIQVARLENKLGERTNRKLFLEKNDLLIQNLTMQVEILNYKLRELKERIEEAKSKRAENLKHYMLSDKIYKEYVKEIEKELNIDKANWGFDPETGKIILDE